MPRHLCLAEHPGGLQTIHAEYERFIDELRSVTADLSIGPATVAAGIGATVERLRGIARRATMLLTKFDDVELFFRPVTLQAVCEHIDSLRAPTLRPPPPSPRGVYQKHHGRSGIAPKRP